MGNIFFKRQKQIELKKNLSDFKTINICSFNIKFYHSIDCTDKIQSLINLIQDDNEQIDIICLQNICNKQILKQIIIKIINLNNDINTKKKLYTYPVFDILQQFIPNINTSKNILDLIWSRSSDDDNGDIESIIISKYPIISSAKIELSDVIFNKIQYLYLININFNNIIISVYNVTLCDDTIGVSNKNIRTQQINELKQIIDLNKETLCKEKTTEIYSSYEYRNIHILCSQLNINEFQNDELNSELVDCFRRLSGLDIYRYVQYIKNKNPDLDIDCTGIGPERTNYIILLNDNNSEIENIKNIANILYKKMKIIIYNSYIVKNIPLFKNNIVKITLLIKDSDKNKIEYNHNYKNKEITIEIEK
jgi:hypothetical protein